MAIYCDTMGHLISDVDLKELHEFAARIGLKRAWFQDKHYPHYDLTTPNALRRAIGAGAVRISPKDLVKTLQVTSDRLGN